MYFVYFIYVLGAQVCVGNTFILYLFVSCNYLVRVVPLPSIFTIINDTHDFRNSNAKGRKGVNKLYVKYYSSSQICSLWPATEFQHQ